MSGQMVPDLLVCLADDLRGRTHAAIMHGQAGSGPHPPLGDVEAADLARLPRLWLEMLEAARGSLTEALDRGAAYADAVARAEGYRKVAASGRELATDVSAALAAGWPSLAREAALKGDLAARAEAEAEALLRFLAARPSAAWSPGVLDRAQARRARGEAPEDAEDLLRRLKGAAAV